MPRTAASAENDRIAAAPLIAFLVQLREDAGIPRAVLAARIGCRLNQLAAWERGEGVPGVFWLSAWAAGLGHDLVLTPQDPNPS